MDEGEVALVAAAHGFVAGLIVVRANQHDFGSVTARCGDLGDRRGQRHADFGGDASLGGVVRDGLRVIAGGGGDYTSAALLVRQQKNLIECAALLERTGHLQVIELEEDGVSGEVREGFGAYEGREVDGIADACAGVSNSLNGQQKELSSLC